MTKYLNEFLEECTWWYLVMKLKIAFLPFVFVCGFLCLFGGTNQTFASQREPNDRQDFFGKLGRY
jgi:hypothetical protein